MIDQSKIDWLLNGEEAEADVLNRPLRQIVGATNDSLDEINTVADNSALLIEERYDEIFEVTRDGNGFACERDAQLIFDAGNATVSIAPGLDKSTWFYYHKGRKIESSETLTYFLTETDKTDGGFYLSFDKDRNFVNTGPHPDFFKTTLCFYVLYSNGEFIIEGDERHSADRDTAWHESHHREDGMVVYTLGSINWTPDDANNVGIQITTTLVADEDLQHLIKHSPTGEEPFNQILEGSQDTVRIPTLYYDGNIRYLVDKKLPWVSDALKYNDGTTLKDVPNGKFVNYFLVATHCQKYPIKLFMGRKIFDSDHETVDETLESLGLNFPEMALLYRISLERDNSLSTVGKCKLKSIQQVASRITFESAAGSGGSGLSNHTQLLGRTEDNAHPVSAITGLQDELDSKADKVHTHPWGEVTGQPATATRWPTFDEVSGKPTTFTPATHTHPVSQVTGLGTAATRNVGVSAGNVMEVGAFGLGAVASTTTYPTIPATGAQIVHYFNSGVPGPLDLGYSDRTSYLEMSSNNHRTTIASDGTSLYFSWVYNKSPAKGDFKKLLTASDLPATATRWPTFAEVSGKPATYAPTAHTHTWAQVTGQPAQATRWPTWAEVTGKPTTFAAATHTHAYLPLTGGTLTGQIRLGSNTGSNWMQGTAGTAAAIRYNTAAASASSWHAWIAGRDSGNNGWAIGTLGTTFSVSHATAANITANNNNTTQILSITSAGASVVGNFTASGNITAYSDIKLKENIELIPDALAKINTLHGYTYNRKDSEDTSRYTGVIAQEVQKVLPEAVIEDGDGTLSVAYGNMVGLLIEAIKEQSKEMDILKEEMKILKERL